MRQFYLEYHQNQKLQTLSAQIGWSHNIECKDKNKLVKTILERLYAINSGDINSYKNSVLKLEVLSELRKLHDVVKEEEMKMVETKISVEKLPSYMIGLEEGEARTIEKGVINLYSFTKDVKTISDMFSISEAKVQEILKKAKKI